MAERYMAGEKVFVLPYGDGVIHSINGDYLQVQFADHGLVTVDAKDAVIRRLEGEIPDADPADPLLAYGPDVEPLYKGRRGGRRAEAVSNMERLDAGPSVAEPPPYVPPPQRVDAPDDMGRQPQKQPQPQRQQRSAEPEVRRKPVQQPASQGWRGEQVNNNQRNNVGAGVRSQPYEYTVATTATKTDMKYFWSQTGWVGMWRAIVATFAVLFAAVPLAGGLWWGNAYFTVMGIGQFVGWLAGATAVIGGAALVGMWARLGWVSLGFPAAFSFAEVGWNPLWSMFQVEWFQKAFMLFLLALDTATTWNGLNTLGATTNPGDWVMFFGDGGMGQILGTAILTVGPEVVIILAVRSIIGAWRPVVGAWKKARTEVYA